MAKIKIEDGLKQGRTEDRRDNLSMFTLAIISLVVCSAEYQINTGTLAGIQNMDLSQRFWDENDSNVEKSPSRGKPKVPQQGLLDLRLQAGNQPASFTTNIRRNEDEVSPSSSCNSRDDFLSPLQEDHPQIPRCVSDFSFNANLSTYDNLNSGSRPFRRSNWRSKCLD